MAFGNRVWGAGKFFLLAGALLATYGLFAVAGMRIALRTREVMVPDLSGRAVNEATTLLAAADLVLEVEDIRRIDPRIALDHIAEQDPQAGLTTRRRRSVRVWLSSGARASAVPTLIGESERGAKRRLQEDALELGRVSEIRSSQYPSGAVVAQEPPPRARGTTVSMLVNRGERGSTYVMPDLIGVTGGRAAEILRARGFRVTIVGDHLYPGVPAGIVLRQFPRAGFQIAPGEPISLEVSQ